MNLQSLIEHLDLPLGYNTEKIEKALELSHNLEYKRGEINGRKKAIQEFKEIIRKHS